MAFTATSFIPASSMANSSAGRMFSYRTGDTLAASKGANYFDAAAASNGLKDGDFVTAEASDGTSILAIAVSGAGVATTALANDFA